MFWLLPLHQTIYHPFSSSPRKRDVNSQFIFATWRVMLRSLCRRMLSLLMDGMMMQPSPSLQNERLHGMSTNYCLCCICSLAACFVDIEVQWLDYEQEVQLTQLQFSKSNFFKNPNYVVSYHLHGLGDLKFKEFKNWWGPQSAMNHQKLLVAPFFNFH